ncbi:MAG: DUF5343 domain-containing protein [Phycisphaerales bacterium]|jgi:hypothetical protein|nr:DUF5343 domain-containing protein [Phycisphaerales bacterium]
MALPDIYTIKPGSIPAYFDAILQAEAPERFSTKFLEGLEFKSTNDRSIIGILKDLKFLDADAKPTKLYFEYLDREQSKKILAKAIRATYADLFSLNKDAHKFTQQETKNKLRTLYAGTKKDSLISLIASTFTALCKYADFTGGPPQDGSKEMKDEAAPPPVVHHPDAISQTPRPKSIPPGSLQYHINIVLPDTRDQAVYDAIFKSLRDHLG